MKAGSERPFGTFGQKSGDPADGKTEDHLQHAAEESGGRKPGRIAREMLAFRRRRDAALPSPLFADPAWDMLLYLLAAEEEGRRRSISRLCRAAAVPMTTALRWVTVLEGYHLVQRTPHPNDGRVVVISLTETGSISMRKLLASDRLGQS